MFFALLASLLLCGGTIWFHSTTRKPTPAAVVASPTSTLVLTQYSVGGPLVPLSFAGGSLVVLTEFASPTFEVQLPPRYYLEGKEVSEAEFFLQTRRPSDGPLGLGLIDTRFQPITDFK
jgi:hypothetical protein